MIPVTNEKTMTAAEVHGSRVDDAYEWLLAEITGFRVRAGAPLSENKLAGQLGISRTPVREALQRLEKEGLVKRTENARFAVSQISSSEVNDACDLLEELDSYIFRKASSKLTDGDVQALRANVAQMAESAREGDRARWAEADTAFHKLVNDVAGNTLVAGMVKEVRRRIQRFWLRASSVEHRLGTCSEEHHVLTEAMIAKDYDAIEPAVVVHIEHMRRSMLDMLANAAILLGDE